MGECSWIGGSCHFVSKELTYEVYKGIFRGVNDSSVCKKLGGYVKRGKTCVSRRRRNVKCKQINTVVKNPGVCVDCARLCDWMPNCEYDLGSHVCNGKNLFRYDYKCCSYDYKW